MKIVIPKQHILIFGRFIHTLAKLRDEISCHCSDDKFTLKCVNSTQTCLAMFQLDKHFFSTFEVAVAEVKLKLHSKSLLYVFKNLYNIEKSCDKVVISYDPTVVQVEDCLRIVFLKAEGIETVFDVNCLEDENDINPNLSYNSEVELNQILFNNFSASSKLFNEVIQSFFSADEQIVLEACQSVIRLKSYVTNGISLSELTNRKASSGKEGCTQMVISQQELLSYNVHYLESSTKAEVSQRTHDVTVLPNGDSNLADATTRVSDDEVLSEIVFNLKHFKVALSLLQILNLELNVNFAHAGLPFRVLLYQTGLFKGQFWISTLNSPLDRKTTSLPQQKQPNKTAVGTNLTNANQVEKSVRDIPDEFANDDGLDDELLCSLPIETNNNNNIKQNQQTTSLQKEETSKSNEQTQEDGRSSDDSQSRISQRRVSHLRAFKPVSTSFQGDENKSSSTNASQQITVGAKRTAGKDCLVHFENVSTQETDSDMVILPKCIRTMTNNDTILSHVENNSNFELKNSSRENFTEAENVDMLEPEDNESSLMADIFGPSTLLSLEDTEPDDGLQSENFEATVLVEDSDVE